MTNSHFALHEVIRMFDKYLNGQATIQDFLFTLESAEKVLKIEDDQMPGFHSHDIAGVAAQE